MLQRPFANYYGLVFILYELSTPFLNFHWFFDQLHMTGSSAQLYNGITLIAVFCLSRLVWGVFQSVRIYQDMYKVLQNSRSDYTVGKDQFVLPDMEGYSAHLPGNQALPIWLVYTYIGSNTALIVLNFVWFSKMIQAVTKRFVNVKPRKE